LGHILDFSVAMLFYFWLYPSIIIEAKVLSVDWIANIITFNLCVEFILYGYWHWMTQKSPKMKPRKYNQEDPYINISDNLIREIIYTTLGWLQSSLLQIIFFHLCASNKLSYEANFMDRPIFNVLSILFVTYWREFHFYWCHRMIHPWWDVKNGLAQGDIGAFLYRHFHSLHHKSYNPGPFSGLSMHPVEHFFYYQCAYLPLFFKLHPLHFLYALYHANIAPIGGHDGYEFPGGDGGFHWLHHSLFECNYGVPLINFDSLFGTYIEFDENYKKKLKDK